MQIDVRTLASGRSSIQRTVTDFGDDGDWPRFADGLACRYDVDRTPHGIVVSITFKGRAVLECARCLEDYELPVSGSCSLLAREAEDDEECGFTEDDTLEFVYDGDSPVIDAGQVIYDEVMTALPMKPLCREDCAGVVRENGGPFEDAGDKGSDPRWDALRKLKERS